MENKKLYLILHPIAAGIMLVLALWWKFSPPSEINPLYGYRTALAMKNQDTWQLANSYGADIFLYSVLVMLVIQFALYYFIESKRLSFLLVLGLQTFVLLPTYLLTEQKLSSTFNEQGEKKNSTEILK